MVNVYSQYGKRILDILLSLILVVVLLPFWVVIILSYVVSFSFPVWYRQPRIGKDEKIFTMIKFRSLSNEAGGPEDRRFLLGDVLRFTSLDEIPQLFNVLAGDMSLTGPRPLPVEYLPLFTEDQRRRHQIRPGITGWAQVNGRNSISWSRKFELDSYYIDHLSMKLDLQILFKTVIILFSFKKDVSLSEERFRGDE